jgi:nucleotide-binding universal stress UspA family protein
MQQSHKRDFEFAKRRNQMSFNHIRVATDGSDGACKAAAVAGELAKTVGALGIPEQSVQSIVLKGHPAEEICKYAREHDVDLVVIDSHGRSGIREALLGSVSHAVANHAPCPITIVR